MFAFKLKEHGLARITPILQMRETEPARRSLRQLTWPSHPVPSLASGACPSFAGLSLFGKHHSCALQEKWGSQAWAEVQTLPPTGSVILGSYLTTLAFIFSFVKCSMAAQGYSKSQVGCWS